MNQTVKLVRDLMTVGVPKTPIPRLPPNQSADLGEGADYLLNWIPVYLSTCIHTP